MSDTNNIAAIDLFCGAGGLTRGMLDAGINVVAGIDNDVHCKYAYEKNNKVKFILKDITEVNGTDLINLYPKNAKRLLAGCAPCQPFSSYARNVDSEKDKRFFLLAQFARLVNEVKPDFVTMENVPRLIHRQIFKNFKSMLEDQGYAVSVYIVSCVDYEIPQKRKRLVFFASKGKKILLENKKNNKVKTVRDTIYNLPKLEAGATDPSDPHHRAGRMSELNLKRIKISKPGGTWNDWSKDMVVKCHRKKKGKTFSAVYGRMEWDKPSPTITTQCTGFGNGRFGHPEQNRALSLREAALLQTFPKKYDFGITHNIPFVAVRRMIGNAVPVKLGKLIGGTIKQYIRGYYEQK